jgi:hypothetical protein
MRRVDRAKAPSSTFSNLPDFSPGFAKTAYQMCLQTVDRACQRAPPFAYPANQAQTHSHNIQEGNTTYTDV